MSDKVSQGAMELAQKVVVDECAVGFDPDCEKRVAALIDQELREVMAWIEKHGHDATCTSHLTWRKDIWPEGNPPCNCGVSALLAKWTVRG